MLEVYTEEFIKIVQYVISKNLGNMDEEGNLLVKKSIVTGLMNHNNYEDSFRKLKTWRRLNWIQKEKGEDSFTKVIKDSKGKSRRVMVINVGVCNMLKELLPV